MVWVLGGVPWLKMEMVYANFLSAIMMAPRHMFPEPDAVKRVCYYCA